MIKKIAFSFLFTVASFCLMAQTAAPTMLYGAVSYDIPSKAVNSSIRVSVSLPQGYHKNANKKYPVFMFLYGGPGSQQVTDALQWHRLSNCQYAPERRSTHLARCEVIAPPTVE